MEKNLQFKKLSSQHLEQYNNLLRYAFQVTEKMLHESGWENDEIRQSKIPVLEHANVFGAFDEDNLVSQFAVYPMDMNIHSAIYSIGFVTSVSTYPEYSGMGLMSKLMKQSLAEMKDKGQTLALLYPFSIPLYRHKGWEIISDKMSFIIRDTQIPHNIEAPGYVRRVPQDSDDLVNLHTRFARQTHGCLLRNNLAWEEYWRWDMDDTTVAIYYGMDETPMGYMVYLIKDDVMSIKEMIYLNAEARKGLWLYVGAHESMIEEVRGYNYYSQPVAFGLEDSDIKETIRPYIMGRIIDLEGFLKKYSFRNDVNSTITLHVSDPILEWNNRSFNVGIEGGRGTLVSDKSDREAHMSVGTLTTLLLGYKSASELAKLEMIRTDADTIRMIDRALICEKPYLSDYI